MIDMPEAVRIIYDEDVVHFNSIIDELKINSVVAKNWLMSENIEPFPCDGSLDDKINFVLQFTDYLQDLIFFPEAAILDKLRELRFANHTLRWFVKLEDVLKEIDVLNKIDGLFFLPSAYLIGITCHLQVKVNVSFFEDFELTTLYNNSETNIIFKDFSERYNRLEYNRKKQQTPKMNYFENLMFKLYNSLEVEANNKVIAKKFLLQSAKGNTAVYYTLLKDFYCEGISKNKVYLELFPLLKLILKDDELLSSEEYFANDNDSKYDADYRMYKIARVKKILLKK